MIIIMKKSSDNHIIIFLMISKLICLQEKCNNLKYISDVLIGIGKEDLFPQIFKTTFQYYALQ